MPCNSSISGNMLYYLCLIGVFSYSLQAHDFPIVPSEPGMKTFPCPVCVDETDAETLKQYYQDVAAAYRKKGDDFKEKYLSLQLKRQKLEEDLMLNQGRAARSYVSWNKSIKQQGTLQSIQYSRKAADVFQAEAETCFEKACFYQDLADHYGLLCRSASDIH